eukprot:TRINITY_DN2610_c0_g1_i2.p1 TRINITY_DN2610_c0_g1~~TRINITY_DN2610_c0_g1_i2.p1  ORF type:complete len:405 (+),score=115.52 TRINITY_DN2610_c0_g1_i2:146-1360(+)
MDIGNLDFDARLHSPLSSSFPPSSATLMRWGSEDRLPLKRSKPPRAEVRKAMLVLGLDLSDEKLKDKLGIDEETLRQAKETARELREQAEQKTNMKLPLNRDGLRKALQVLGEDPSRKKIMDKFGIDEVQLHDVEKELHQMRWENPDVSEARQSFIFNRKDYKKALAVLGYDPSAEKLMRIYGFQPEDLEIARRESLALSDTIITNTTIPGRTSRKALKFFGVDPSREKLMHMYGFDDEEVTNAINYRNSLVEERFHDPIAQKKRLHISNRAESKKAFDLLGEDPSERKLLDKLGVGKETFEKAKEEAEKHRIEVFIETQKKDLAEAPEKAQWVLGEKQKPTPELILDTALSPREEARLRHIPDKRNSSKAISVLGIDTKEKIADKLGISGEELRQVSSPLPLI